MCCCLLVGCFWFIGRCLLCGDCYVLLVVSCLLLLFFFIVWRVVRVVCWLFVAVCWFCYCCLLFVAFCSLFGV